MFKDLVQNWRNTSWLGVNLASQIAPRSGIGGKKKLILKGSDSAYTYDNIGRGKFLESLDYHYSGALQSATNVLYFYYRGDPYDVFHSPDQIDEYTLVAEFAISTASVDRAQPINLYVPPWAWLYVSSATGDKWTINFTGLDSDWVAVKDLNALESGSGAVITSTSEIFTNITFEVIPPFPYELS